MSASSFQMSSTKSSKSSVQSEEGSRSCRTHKCREERAFGHKYCAYHADCGRKGTFDPTQCKVCQSWFEVITDNGDDFVENLQQWKLLKDQFEQAVRLAQKHKKPEMKWVSAEVAKWFPEVGNVAEGPEESLEEATAQENPQLAELMKLLKESISSQNNTSKRTLEDREIEQRSKYRRTDRSEESEYSEDESKIANERAIPHPSLGWRTVPSHWHILEDKESVRAVTSVLVDGITTLVPVEEAELMIERIDGKRTVFWRPKKDSEDETISPGGKVKAMAQALTSLSALVKGAPNAPSVSVGNMHSSYLSVKISDSSNIKMSTDEVKKFWRVRAASKNASLTNKNTSKIPKISLVWPKGSDSEELSNFLGSAKAVKADFPEFLNAPNQTEMNADAKARSAAMTVYQTKSLLDLLTDMLNAATNAKSIEPFDFPMVTGLAAEVTSGISALIQPLTKELCEEAVEKRIALRSAAIPTKLKDIKNQILTSEPLHAAPMGEIESLQSLLKDVPKTLQVTLPAHFYSAIAKNQSSYDKKKSNFQNNRKSYSTNNRQQNNKNRSYNPRQQEPDTSTRRKENKDYQSFRKGQKSGQDKRSTKESGKYQSK